MDLPVVIKQKNKWIVGFIKNNNFVEKEVFKKLSDIRKFSNFKKLSNYVDKNKEKRILKKYNTDRIYVLDIPFNPTVKEMEKWWWNDYNKICKKCVKSCKQSNKVILTQCKGYEKI